MKKKFEIILKLFNFFSNSHENNQPILDQCHLNVLQKQLHENIHV